MGRGWRWGNFGGFSLPRFWDLWDLQIMEYVDIFMYTKSNALMHFIDTYVTKLSATHWLVCSRQNNIDMLKSLQFEI